jgi:ABC-type multidrug transport system fused ATPase/permease subunit
VNNSVLLLDEPAAALRIESQGLVQQSLEAVRRGKEQPFSQSLRNITDNISLILYQLQKSTAHVIVS